MNLLNLRIAPYVRIDLLQVITTQSLSLGNLLLMHKELHINLMPVKHAFSVLLSSIYWAMLNVSNPSGNKP